mmetsp:Transcript_23542/g.63802  ORF Transcript_23542/g.63802 Transcript_23542/m.63802 type:complete len:456 (-) Transcript_23542:561-1928(-)
MSSLNTMCCPFTDDDVANAFDPNEMSYIEVASDSKLYSLILKHLAESVTSSRASRRIVTHAVQDNSDSEDSDHEESDACCASGPTSLHAGLGMFKFAFGDSDNLFALHKSVGKPLAQSCGGIDMFTHIILFGETTSNGLKTLQDFCNRLIMDSEKSQDGTFSIFRWQVRHQYWKREVKAVSRPLSSVVLPSEDKAKLIEDVEDFLAPATKRWYRQHGIPYRRAYLFHGVPGAGKTSLLQSLAGCYKRNLCFLQPSHPDITDDALKAAVQNVPGKALIVIEDIDALFTKERSLKNEKAGITFSGLLNALDGVSAATGQLIVLTTNFRERLDSALVRPGRVDVQIEFGFATRDQMSQLFVQFYPSASVEQGSKFADKVIECLRGRNLSMAALQNYFIVSRTRSFDEAIENVHEISKELEGRESMMKVNEAKPKEKSEMVTADTDKDEHSSSSSADDN